MMLFYTAFVAIFAVTNGMLVQPRQELENQIATDELNDSALCTVCEMVVQKAVDQLYDGATEAEIERLVKRVCGIMPGIIKTECDSLVDQYGERIVHMLADSVEPHKICGLLRVCSTQTVTNGMRAQPRPKLEKHITKDVELNKPLCNVCEAVVKEVEHLLEDGSTKEEIEKLVKKVCDKLPGVIGTECDSLVDEYGDKIIDLLVNSLDPSKVCSTLKLC